jgi:lipoic acid synthetase
MTVVDRDDLADSGARHIAETVRRAKQKRPDLLVEVLTGDFWGKLHDAKVVAESGLDVFAHNIETVEGLTPYVRDRRATFRQSLSVLKHAKDVMGDKIITKTSMMLGLGEQEQEVMEALKGMFPSILTILNITNILYRTAQDQRRRSHLRPIHAPNQASPQGREVRHSRRI